MTTTATMHPNNYYLWVSYQDGTWQIGSFDPGKGGWPRNWQEDRHDS